MPVRAGPVTMGRIPHGPPGRTEDAGRRDFIVGLRLAAKRTKGGPRGMESVGVLGPTAHPGLPLKVFLGVGRCRRL
jgi:hypothetical protein